MQIYSKKQLTTYRFGTGSDKPILIECLTKYLHNNVLIVNTLKIVIPLLVPRIVTVSLNNSRKRAAEA